MTPYYDEDGITIYHGDCREVTAWLSADVLITDPPYGMSFVSSYSSVKRPIIGDDSTDARDSALRMWGDVKPAAVFGTWKVARPNNLTNRLIWDKSDGTGPGIGDLSQAFGNSDEEIYLLGAWPRRGERTPNVIRTSIGMASYASDTGHPTPKPVSLMARLIGASSGQVADPFCGSGSTLVACQMLGRKAIGVEREEKYCEIAAKRLSQRALPLGVA